MRARIAGLIPPLVAHRVSKGRAIDILVTHSPPFGIHDGQDLPHRGFKSLLTLMRYARPRFMLHGHTHLYRSNTPSETHFHETTVLNVYPLRVIEW
jgi:Icc-related predicted phosphoesterase